MINIRFQDEQQYNQQVRKERKSFFVRLVLETGIVSTEKQAGYILLSIATLGFFITGMLLFMGNRATGLSNTDIQRITQLQQSVQQPTQ